MSYLGRVEDQLARIAAAGRLRHVEARQPVGVLDFSSNDYLALSTDPQVVTAFKHATRAGSGGARLLGGRHREHSLLEEELAAWLGRERALLFSSGYLAALGAVTVLSGVSDVIYSDALNHASLIDGMRLSRTPREIHPHGDLPACAHRRPRALIVTESLFSMDGDCADVRAIARDLGDDDVLLLDEAHALGVMGPSGAGLAHGINDPRVVVMGTLSKALGSQGGFVAGPASVIDLLVNAARSFIFDTAPSPALALAARVALSIARRADDRRARLYENAQRLRAGLRALGIDAQANGASPIVPVVLGSEQRAVHVAAELLARNVYAPAVRPPTVPDATSRLRISLRADHATEHVDLLLSELQRCIATS